MHKYYTTSNSICKKFADMGLLFCLFFAVFLARTYSIREVHYQEVDKFENSPLHLPLYRVRSFPHSVQTSDDTPPSFLHALALDEARVKFLNSRLANKNSTKTERLVDGEFVSVPLNPGVPLGIQSYYTSIGIGTPTTNHLVLIDTGSSFSWTQCEPCARCHSQLGPRFNPSASETYQQLPCDASQCSSLEKATLNSPMCSSSNVCLYTAIYGDGSFSQGYLSQDLLTIGSESLEGFVFGCGQDNEGLFGSTEGLVGLAKDELSMFSQLSTKYGNSFSYCLPSASPLGETGSGGFLSFGTSSDPGYKFTPMLSDSRDSTLYFLKLSAISVSGAVLNVAANEYNVPMIIDSGTTISQLGMGVYSALRDEVVKVVSSKFRMAEPVAQFDACFEGGFGEISAVVPSVNMIFEGEAELNLAAQNVVIEVKQGTTCLAFAGNSDGDIAILGSQQQETFSVLYDVASSRIGFATGGCS